jgi:hypothetical protein
MAKIRRLNCSLLLALSLLVLVPFSAALVIGITPAIQTPGSAAPLAVVQRKPRRTFSATAFNFVDPPTKPQSRSSGLFSRLSLRASSRTAAEAPFYDKLATISQAAAGTALIVGFERSIWAIGQSTGVKIPSAPVCPKLQNTTVE